jgi:hypothetical protein
LLGLAERCDGPKEERENIEEKVLGDGARIDTALHR